MGAVKDAMITSGVLQSPYSPKCNILQRLAAVQGELDYLQKSKPKSGLQYSYVSHDQVTGAVRPLMVKHGIVYYPANIDVTQDGNRTQCKMDVVFANIDDRADFITVATLGYGIDAQDKGPGKAISYCIKYALLKTLSLETGDDPDHDQNVKHEPAVMIASNGTNGASKAPSRAPYDAMVKDIRKATGVKALQDWYAHSFAEIEKLPPDFVDELRIEYTDKLSELKKGLAA